MKLEKQLRKYSEESKPDNNVVEMSVTASSKIKKSSIVLISVDLF